MNYFALMTPAAQDQRIRELKRSGLRDEMIASLTGRSVNDIRRTLANPITPRSAVFTAAVFSGPSA